MAKYFSLYVMVLASLLILITCGYTPCPDGESACGSDQRCCLKRSGSTYTCCPYYSSCCDGGSSCCGSTKANEFLVEDKTPAMEAMMTMAEPTEQASLNLNELAIISHTEEERLNNAILGSLIVIDSFFNTTQLYKYSRNTGNCKNEGYITVTNIINAISIVNHSKDMSKVEFLIKLTESLSEVFYHAKSTMDSCKNSKEELQSIYQLILNYVEQDGYMTKVLENAENNYSKIIEYINDARSNWVNESYEKCGEALGLLFNLVFVI
jgi:hypothetical protein